MQKPSNQPAGLIYTLGVNDRFMAGVMIDEIGAGVTRGAGKKISRKKEQTC